MLGLFTSVKPYVTPKPKIQVPRPDNLIFRLHYKLTFSILMVGCILVSSYSYIDSSDSAIQCMQDKGLQVPQEVINRYCWITSTFTLPKHFEGNKGEDFLHYGVGPHSDDDEKVFHAYYQWVPIVLFFQALMFYAPHWIWKQMEGGRMKHIIVGLNNHIENEDERSDKINQLADYLHTRLTRMSGEHQMWAIKFFICECLNFVNVIVQIFLTDWFLGGEFTQFGTEVLRFPAENPENRVDPMSRVFPRMTKCIFHKFGGSGTIQKFDALCVLGMNIINEKIYIFLWFWFIALAVVTGMGLVVRMVQLFCPNVRDRFVKLESRGYLDLNVSRSDVESVVRRLSYSDWLILYNLAQAMDKQNFGDLMAKLSDELPNYRDLNGDSGDVENRRRPPGSSDDATLKSPAKLRLEEYADDLAARPGRPVTMANPVQRSPAGLRAIPMKIMRSMSRDD